MSAGQVSSPLSSSDCSTARASPSNLRSDDVSDNNSTGFEAVTQSKPPLSVGAASVATLPASDAFASPRSGRNGSVGVPSSVCTTTTVAQGRGPNQERFASFISTKSSALLIPSSVNDARPSGLAQSLPLAPNEAASGPLNRPRGMSQASGEAVGERPADYSTTAPPSLQRLPLPENVGDASVKSSKLSVPQSAASSPLAPSSRGAENGRWRRANTIGGANGFSPLPPLAPPVRRPPLPSTTGSRSVKSLNSPSQLTTADGAKTSPLGASTGSAADTMVQPLATVRTTEDGESGWWEAVCRLVANRAEQVSTYLENLVDPGGVAAAAATEAPAGYASRARGSQRVPRSPIGSTSIGGSASMSSDSGVTYGRNGRSPPARAQLSSAAGRGQRALFEPFNNTAARPSGTGRENSEGSLTLPLDLVVIDPSQGPLFNKPTASQPTVSIVRRDAVNDSFTGDDDKSVSDVDYYAGEPNTYVVDLLSALRGYQSSPTEPFGHLVAAALASRSKEAPVRGFEIAAADHNPYLVRLILDSGTLDEADAEAQRHVKETMAELFSVSDGVLSPAIYEYLTSFFRMPFMRLSHREYTMLKRSGFEYIKLMYDHQHVLPDEPLHSILINQSRMMQILNLIFMVVQLCAIIFSTVAIALVLAKWMVANGGSLQNFGFYTLIVYGGGWALNLICIICTVRSRQDEAQYEPRYDDGEYVMVPSPYLAVVPVLPLFDMFCLIAYVRALKQKRMIYAHNIVACSRLSSIFYATLFAFPQLITQAYFNNIQTSIDAQLRHSWPYIVLVVATVTQWCLALIGYAWLLFTHDSIDGFGFACFNVGKVPHILERHTAAAHVLHFVMASVLETNVFLLTTTAIALPVAICGYYHVTILVLSSFTIVYILLVYAAIILIEGSTVRISFSSVPLLLIQLALLVSSERVGAEECASFRHLYFRQTFIFGYLSWGAYFTFFVVWLILMVKWCVLLKTEVNLFPRLLWPLARRDTRFTSQTKADAGMETSPTDTSSGGAA
ncbi:hypothetical protein LSCM1_02699 [Leishmania martiniquensis]|uniref:Transmembrane protein n=1 Tax=Leishmania martiniquensis TaxID=1580590 RepID=A0A836KKW8_9TRYP|nr:hypothetical protein LSCM1_02699 [Leishmania martiniquensis]